MKTCSKTVHCRVTNRGNIDAYDLSVIDSLVDTLASVGRTLMSCVFFVSKTCFLYVTARWWYLSHIRFDS